MSLGATGWMYWTRDWDNAHAYESYIVKSHRLSGVSAYRCCRSIYRRSTQWKFIWRIYTQYRLCIMCLTYVPVQDIQDKSRPNVFPARADRPPPGRPSEYHVHDRILWDIRVYTNTLCSKSWGCPRRAKATPNEGYATPIGTIFWFIDSE